jgi:MFS transporter, OFA family, oxalate/formate antiporter
MKKIFYGWYMLIGMVLMYAATNGLGMYAFSVMRPLQIKAFGLDAQSAAFLPTVLFLTIAIISPFIGRLLDKWDPRKMIIIGASSAVVLTFLQAFVPNYGVLSAFYAFFGIAMTFSGIISFMFLINRWFAEYKGLAAGILLLGSSLGGIIFPKIAVMAGSDWQQACMYLGIAGAVFLLPPLLLIRNSPEEMGEVPDGKTSATANTPPSRGVGMQAQYLDQNITLQEALKSVKFYLVLFVTAVLWFCINGYIQNHGFFMKDMNQDAASAAKVLGTFSMMAILGKLVFGYLSDKFDRNYIMILSISIMAISIYLLKTSLSSPELLTAFALVFGVGFGGAFTIIQVWVADMYSGKSFGAILGFVTMIDTLAGSAGMISLGSMRKASGSFSGGFDLLLGLCVVAMVSAFFVKKVTSK